MHYAIHTVGYSRNHRSRPIWDLSGVCLSAAQWPQIKSTQHSKVSAHPRAKYAGDDEWRVEVTAVAVVTMQPEPVTILK